MTEEGLRIEDLVEGHGRAVKNGDKVKTQYVGHLRDGTEFDSTFAPGRRPFEVTIGKGYVIRGWELGLIGMRAGGKRRLTVPGPLGYGERGRPPKIPPNAELVFEIELLDVE